MPESAPQAIPHLVVRASAGAGKTYQLTTRYLQLLRRGEPMQHVLATTFTRKAAGEVLARVLGRLCAACAYAKQREHLSIALGGAPLSKASCLVMLRTLTEGLGRLSVGTIDGFFNRAARALSLELGLPADPRLIDEGSPLARQMRTDAIHAVLGEQAAGDDGLTALIEMLRRLHHDTAQRGVTDAIDSIVVQLDEVYRSYPARELWDTLPKTGLLDAGLLSTALHGLEAMEPALPQTKSGSVNKVFAKAFYSLLNDTQAGRWGAVLNNGLVDKIADQADLFARAEITDAWRQAIYPLFIHAKATRIRALADQTRATYELLALFHRQYQSLRYGQGVLLFSDLTHVLAEGLPGKGEAGVEELCYRLDARVTHLLLDEFQDTSLRQWEVLKPFAEQVVSMGDHSRSLFCVGDAKQAIYGWRGGCAELFDAVEQLPGVERALLSKSWRSSSVVLDAVNRVFETLGSNRAAEDCREAADAWHRGYQTHLAAQDQLPGHVVLHTTASDLDLASDGLDEADESAPPDAHAHYVAAYIRQLSAVLPGRSIGVLVRRRASALRLMHELRVAGVFAAEEGGNPIANVPAVSAVLAAIQLADHPGDRVARFHVLNSPVAEVIGLSAAAASQHADTVARMVRRSLLDHGYARVISGWVRQLAASCDAKSLRRLMQLIELAERFDEADGGLRPGFFVQAAQAAKVEDPSPAMVRVMTVHASKGLEFDVVVLPDLDGVLSASDARDLVVLQRDTPIDPVRGVYRRANKDTMKLLPQLEQATEQRTREKRTEDLCLLYVAMTRARQALHLLVRPLSPAMKTGQPTGIPTRKGLTNLSYAAILRQALRREADEGFEGDARLYEAGDARWAGQPPREPLCADDRDQDATPRSIRLAQGKTGRERSWVQTTPSALHDSGTVTVQDLLRMTPTAGRSYGTLIHALLQRVGFLDEGLPDEAGFDLVVDASGHHDIDAAQALDRVKLSLAAAPVRALLSRNGADVLWRERDFLAQVDGRLVKGSFDRVHLWRENDALSRALLIDFKTDRVDDTTIDAVAAGYTDQLALYRDALSEITGLRKRSIEAKLCFLGDGRVVSI